MTTLIANDKAVGWILPNGRFQEVDYSHREENFRGHLGYAMAECEALWGTKPQDPEKALMTSGYVKVGSDGVKRYARTFGTIKARQWQTLEALNIKTVLEVK